MACLRSALTEGKSPKSTADVTQSVIHLRFYGLPPGHQSIGVESWCSGEWIDSSIYCLSERRRSVLVADLRCHRARRGSTPDSDCRTDGQWASRQCTRWLIYTSRHHRRNCRFLMHSERRDSIRLPTTFHFSRVGRVVSRRNKDAVIASGKMTSQVTRPGAIYSNGGEIRQFGECAGRDESRQVDSLFSVRNDGYL